MKKKIIHSDPAIMRGKPVIAGTRITVELVLAKMAAGETIEQILRSYPHLTKQGIYAALEYAAHALASEVSLPIPKKAA